MSLRAERTSAMRDAACTGKERYTSFARAAAVASRRAHNKGAKLGAYRCKWCGGVHIGNNLSDQKSGARGIDQRQRYVVLAVGPDNRELVIGYSAEPDGGAVARRLIDTTGWLISRIVDRKPHLKPGVP